MTKRAASGLAATCCAALALSGCAATPPDEDPVQIKLNDVDARLARLEKMVTNQSLFEVSNQIEALRSDVRAMHNDVDQLNNGAEAARKQQRDLYTDLDQRLRSLEGRGGSASVGTAASGAAASGLAASAGAAGTAAARNSAGTAGSASGDDRASYQAAFNLLKDGQYDRAIVAFQQFLASYPDSTLADNGQYWLGEAYYVNRSFPEAQASFQRVVDKYPQSRKIADALLKIGYCRYETKQFDSARQVLLQVGSQYPDTPAARLAQQRLDKMAAEKH